MAGRLAQTQGNTLLPRMGGSQGLAMPTVTSFLLFLVELGVTPKGLHMVGKYSTAEPHTPQDILKQHLLHSLSQELFEGWYVTRVCHGMSWGWHTINF